MPILMSIRQEWYDLIASGEKTVEVRKSFPMNFIPERTVVFFYVTKKGRPARLNHITGMALLMNEEFKPLDLTERGLRGTCLTVEQAKEYAQGSNLYGWRLGCFCYTPLYSIHDLLCLDRPTVSWRHLMPWDFPKATKLAEDYLYAIDKGFV